MNVLLIGTGSIGCEIIAYLLKKDFQSLTLVDNDVVEIVNLKKQRFFKLEDQGESKVNVIKKLFPEKKIKVFNKKIQQLSSDEFECIDIMVLAVDNLETRIFCNDLLFKINRIKFLIDLGNEGFLGHLFLIQKKKSPCISCYSDLYSVGPILNPCSLTGTPYTFD